MTLLSFPGQVTCMKLVQRVVVTTVSTCLYEMALMIKVGVPCHFPFPRRLLVLLLQSHDKSTFLSKGYKHLFQPVINQVVDYYQPTCIVLQVSKQASVHLSIPFRGCRLEGASINALCSVPGESGLVCPSWAAVYTLWWMRAAKGWGCWCVSGKQCLCSKNSVVILLFPSAVLILWVVTVWVVLTSV